MVAASLTFVVLGVPRPIINGIILSSPAEVYYFQYEYPYQEWVITPRYSFVKNHQTFIDSKRYVKYTTKWPEYHMDYVQPKNYPRYNQQPKTMAKFQFLQALYEAVEREIAKAIVHGLIDSIHRFHSVSPR